jgi:hypothetical protein
MSTYKISTMKVTVKKEVRMAYPSIFIEGRWIGVGYVGPKRRRKPVVILRIRNEIGFCSYYFWSGNMKGERAWRVFGFRRFKEVGVNRVMKRFDRTHNC